MAKIHEEVLVIRLSKLVKHELEPGSLVDDEMAANLEAVIQQLVDDSVIVEVDRG